MVIKVRAKLLIETKKNYYKFVNMNDAMTF